MEDVESPQQVKQPNRDAEAGGAEEQAASTHVDVVPTVVQSSAFSQGLLQSLEEPKIVLTRSSV